MSLKLILRDRQFAGLFWTQLLGALNDNLLKTAMVTMITFQGVTLGGMDANSLVAAAGGLFILPFFIFSPLAGQLSDKLEKTQLLRATKIWELIIMSVGVVGFYTNNFSILLAVLFLMGVQSAFFGPAKYSLIPQIVTPEKLMATNAYVELGTFMAILVGTIGGGAAAGAENAKHIISAGIIGLAVLGIVTSRWMSPVAPGMPDLQIRYNPIPQFREMWSILRERKAVFNSVLAISWFWFFGAGILSVLPIYVKDFLKGDETVATAFLAAFTIGIGIGSILSEKLSHERVEIGLVPIGSLGMSIFMIDLFLIWPSWIGAQTTPMGFSQFIQTYEGLRLMGDFLMTSIFGGMFIVPLYALVQERSDSSSRSRVVAANNVVNALFMVLSSALVMIFHHLKFSLPQIFLALSLMNLIVAVYVYTVVPEFTLRFISFILSRMMYRIKVVGEEHIPKDGGVILACNHVSFIDFLLVMGAVRRPARFIMYYKFFEIPLLRYIMRQARVIPIAGKNEDEGTMNRAFEMVSSELKEGEVVCIFPEGKITHDGKMAALKPGILKIIERDPVPVVPMAINDLWGSMFSRKDGPAFMKAPRKLWRRIEIKIAEPIPARQLTMELLEKRMKSIVVEPATQSSP